MRRCYRLLSALVLVIALLLSACSQAGADSSTSLGSGAEESGHTITAEQGKKLMQEGQVVVVDVRTAEEYQQGHIPGAINLPNEEIGDVQPEALPDLDAPLILYCKSGVRCKEAVVKLLKLGYTDVSNMGGIEDWTYETVAGSEPGEFPANDASGAADEEEVGLLSQFTTVDLDGAEVNQSVLEDYDLTMVNVWATYCGPCLMEMPDLGEIAEEYRKKGVQIIGLASDTFNSDGSVSESQVEIAKDIVEQTGANYLHILPCVDFSGFLAQIYAVPTTFFVDSEGRQVGKVYVQVLDKEGWIEVIEEQLEEVQSRG